MLIVEKEGVEKQLAPFSDEKGIALLNTRGFLTEQKVYKINYKKEM